MNANHREWISITLTLSIIALAVFVIHRFIPSLIWAAIIVIATWPLYTRWQQKIQLNPNISAFLFTFFMAVVLVLPLSWLVGLLVKETQVLIAYLQVLNREGGEAPDFLQQLPWIGQELANSWHERFGQPGKVYAYLSEMHLTFQSLSYYVRQIGLNVAHRGVQFGFTVLTLFFFYRDGQSLLIQINELGHFCLGTRWFRYADRLPKALRATVNGTILVGLGVGLLMGLCYFFVGFPAPTLTGFITAIAAMIPFLVPVVFVIVALILVTHGAFIAAIVVLAWGTLVMFVADHFVKPVLIGGAIELPFLAVLFGILGGVETLGLLGLFLGPVIMVLFMTLWQEPDTKALKV